MSSIIRESFREYIKKQFSIRQTLIAKGNSDKGSTSRLTGPDGLAPGAFYSYGQKQCVIRLSSMVDLMEDIGLDLGGSKFESYKGETFARNFILEGGVLSDYERRDGEGNRVVRKVTEVRGGFPKPGKQVNLSYGDPSIASNPDSDGYGAVPMPGIIDANIRTKSAYGSLREAKVNFVCHNLRQLEILELLYMRPGYPVLMEWGWSPYINNNGEIINTFPSISDEDYFWDDKQVNQQDLQVKIIDKKRTSNGNYDGFVGFVTNFNYTARADGGFNCSTELISMGEVIDSLKVPSVGFSNIDQADFSELDENDKKKIVYRSSLGVLIQDINDIVNQPLIEEVKKATNYGVGYSAGEPGAFRSFENRQFTEITTTAEKKNFLTRKKLTDKLGTIAASEAFIEKNQLVVEENSKIPFKTGYIRWDALSTLINEFVIPTNEKNQKPLRIETNLFRSQPDGNIALDPILYSKYSDANDAIMDVSCGAKICILPHQFNNFSNDDITLTFSQRVGNIIKSIFAPGSFKSKLTLFTNAFTAESAANKTNFEDLQVKKEIAERRIGGIYIGVNFLVETFENTFTNNRDTTLGDFLKKIWDGINEQCPMHNFGLRVDHEFTDIVQVIDLPLSTNDLKDIEELDYDKLFKFNVHSNDTIVREFKYDTQIPNALKATIAINAQSGATSDDLDSVTFAAFNRSIKSRLSSLSEKFSENEAKSYANIQKTRQEKKERLAELQDSIIEYNDKFFNLLDAKENDDYESEFGNIKSIIKEAQSLELYLEKSTSGYLKNQAIIPINLNLVIDGISGINMFNVFKVDETRLPKAYRQRRVGFIVLGEEQNITSGQDWTTNIRGQVILFPSLEETKNLGKLRDPIQITRDNQRTQFNSAQANEITRINTQNFAAAESTQVAGFSQVEIDRRLEAEGVIEVTEVGSVGTRTDVNNARTRLAGNLIFGSEGEGYSILEPDNGLYELYQKQLNDGSYQITYILTEGEQMGLIVDVGIYPDLSDISSIKGAILATGRF